MVVSCVMKMPFHNNLENVQKEFTIALLENSYKMKFFLFIIVWTITKWKKKGAKINYQRRSQNTQLRIPLHTLWGCQVRGVRSTGWCRLALLVTSDVTKCWRRLVSHDDITTQLRHVAWHGDFWQSSWLNHTGAAQPCIFAITWWTSSNSVTRLRILPIWSYLERYHVIMSKLPWSRSWIANVWRRHY